MNDHPEGRLGGSAGSEVVIEVGRDGRISRSGGAGGGLPAPAKDGVFLEWLLATVGPDERERVPSSPPLVLLVRRSPTGSDLLVSARRPARPSGGSGLPRRLVGFKRNRTFLFDPARVLAFELRSGLVHATFEDGETYTTNYSIRGLAERLAPAGFFRAHRDVVVNLKRVKEIEKLGQGRVRLLLDTPDAPGFSASRPASARLRRLLRF